jgi:hypothetical protein
VFTLADVPNILNSSFAVVYLLPHDRPRAFARAYVEGYFAHVPEAWRDRLPLYYAAVALKRARVTLRQQAPG